MLKLNQSANVEIQQILAVHVYFLIKLSFLLYTVIRSLENVTTADIHLSDHTFEDLQDFIKRQFTAKSKDFSSQLFK